MGVRVVERTARANLTAHFGRLKGALALTVDGSRATPSPCFHAVAAPMAVCACYCYVSPVLYSTR
jgi:hypothetical protein